MNDKKINTKLPDFIIVGAAKSGTTSLYNYLNQHPSSLYVEYERSSLSSLFWY